ncbi:MAG: SDR family NAD(P)-dependent oxidoreductase [Rhizobiales bacterium]|nr:SDR family NAD(P)-dependent oxidoreductase [Hyphomicrobiales bacterium]
MARRGILDHILRRHWRASDAPQADAGRAPWIVVTGGSRGIGYEIARAFAVRGGTLLLVARNAEGVSAAARRIAAESGATVEWYAMDIALANAARRIETRVAEAGGYVDLLVNNAGIGLAGPFIEQADGRLEEVMAVNMLALTRLSRHFLPGMVARGRGGLIMVSSLGGAVPGPGQAVYYASKAYVQSLSEALAEEVAGTGVRVLAVAPGPVDTRFHESMGAAGSLYLAIPGTISARRVARATRLGYAIGLRSIVPGLVAPLAGLCLWLLPHALSVPIVARLLATKQRNRPS